jgi:hypothetical protein
MLTNQIEWDVAEVLDYERTYQYVTNPAENSNLSELFALRVRSCSQLYNQKIYIVKPSNISIKKIPLVGEFVLIYKSFNQQTTDKIWRETWYYHSTIDIQSSINENMIPGISGRRTAEEINAIKPGNTFSRKSISPIQPYEGDILIEGRNGNSIRFSSTLTTNYPSNYYYKSPSWIGSDTSAGDPIIILSNRTLNKSKKEFVVENINSDASSLYLTTTQTIPDLKLSKDLTVYNTFSNQSQLIGVGDRVILRAKKDIALIDSEKAIVLNTPGEIKIGDDSADQAMVHGEILYQIILKLANAIASGGTASGAIVTTNAASVLTEIYELLPELKSKQYKIKKT